MTFFCNNIHIHVFIKNILQNQQPYDRNAYKYPQNELELWLWHLVPLSTIFQLFELMSWTGLLKP